MGDLDVAMAGGNPSRFSTFNDTGLNEANHRSTAFGEALECADPDRCPIIPACATINADLGTTMGEVVTEGLDVQEALDGVAKRNRALMEEEGDSVWQQELSILPARAGAISHGPDLTARRRDCP